MIITSFVRLVRQHSSIVYVKTVLFLAFDSSLVASGNVRPALYLWLCHRSPGAGPTSATLRGTSDWWLEPVRAGARVRVESDGDMTADNYWVLPGNRHLDHDQDTDPPSPDHHPSGLRKPRWVMSSWSRCDGLTFVAYKTWNIDCWWELAVAF